VITYRVYDVRGTTNTSCATGYITRCGVDPPLRWSRYIQRIPSKLPVDCGTPITFVSRLASGRVCVCVCVDVWIVFVRVVGRERRQIFFRVWRKVVSSRTRKRDRYTTIRVYTVRVVVTDFKARTPCAVFIFIYIYIYEYCSKGLHNIIFVFS